MVVKHLKDSCSLKLDKMKDKHRKFFDKYFVDVFENEGISYEILFEKNRKVNKSYISTLMKSKLFEKDFREFLTGGFLQRYEEMRQKKVSKIVQKCNSLIKVKKQGRQLVQEYLEKNGKCKLPWTDEEVSTAVNYFIEWYYGKIKPKFDSNFPNSLEKNSNGASH